MTISPLILNLCTEITTILGRYEGLTTNTPQPQLRKSNRIKTIQGSVAIEGNTLSIDQVTTILNQKPVIGPQPEILEVKNAIAAYEALRKFQPYSSRQDNTSKPNTLRALTISSFLRPSRLRLLREI